MSCTGSACARSTVRLRLHFRLADLHLYEAFWLEDDFLRENFLDYHD